MTEKLLPCPFCGGEVVGVQEDKVLLNGHRYWRIYHLNPGCVLTDGIGKVMLDSSYSTREKAIAAWNRRAEPVNKPLTLDEMNALNHEPIYILHVDGHGKWSMNGWHIATASSYRNHGRCDLEIDNGNTIIDMQNYGKTWLAYRSKPGEEV